MTVSTARKLQFQRILDFLRSNGVRVFILRRESVLLKQLKQNRGFSLVEILVGVAIFTISMIAILTMVLTSIRGNASSQQMTEARFLAQGKLEELLNVQPVANLLDGNDDPNGDGQYQRSWTILNGPTLSSRWIQVMITWDGSDHNVTLRSMARDAGS